MKINRLKNDISLLPPKAKRVFQGEIFDIYQWDQLMFDGTTALFEKIVRADTVTIIPIIENKILIQYQEQPYHHTFISLPGGRVDQNEDVLTASKRELIEETGYKANEWISLMKTQPFNKMIWKMHYYIARDCIRTNLQHLDSGEKIENRLISFDEFLLLSENELFRDKELARYILQIRLHPEKLETFKKLLFK
ncbi:MAG: NUDIX hydrolase [Candidatus Roizmanbacteria bacterium]